MGTRRKIPVRRKRAKYLKTFFRAKVDTLKNSQPYFFRKDHYFYIPLSSFLRKFSACFNLICHLDTFPLLNFRELDLKKPIYAATAANGHFGHAVFPWEQPKELKIRPNLAAKIKEGY